MTPVVIRLLSIQKVGNEFPITETSDIVYTLMSCSADDWQVVIEDDKSKNDKIKYKVSNLEKMEEVFGLEIIKYYFTGYLMDGLREPLWNWLNEDYKNPRMAKRKEEKENDRVKD